MDADKDQWPIFLTAQEVADILRISRGTVQRLIDDGEIPASRPGSKWLVEDVDLREYLAKIKTSGSTRSSGSLIRPGQRAVA